MSRQKVAPVEDERSAVRETRKKGGIEGEQRGVTHEWAGKKIQF